MQKKKNYFCSFLDFGHSIKLLKIGAKKRAKSGTNFFYYDNSFIILKINRLLYDDSKCIL